MARPASFIPSTSPHRPSTGAHHLPAPPAGMQDQAVEGVWGVVIVADQHRFPARPDRLTAPGQVGRRAIEAEERLPPDHRPRPLHRVRRIAGRVRAYGSAKPGDLQDKWGGQAHPRPATNVDSRANIPETARPKLGQAAPRKWRATSFVRSASYIILNAGSASAGPA